MMDKYKKVTDINVNNLLVVIWSLVSPCTAASVTQILTLQQTMGKAVANNLLWWHTNMKYTAEAKILLHIFRQHCCVTLNNTGTIPHAQITIILLTIMLKIKLIQKVVQRHRMSTKWCSKTLYHLFHAVKH